MVGATGQQDGAQPLDGTDRCPDFVTLHVHPLVPHGTQQAEASQKPSPHSTHRSPTQISPSASGRRRTSCRTAVMTADSSSSGVVSYKHTGLTAASVDNRPAIASPPRLAGSEREVIPNAAHRAGRSPPYLEASSLGPADGRPPSVHHHHIFGAGGRGAASARNGPHGARARQVPQHRPHPPRRPAARLRRRHLVRLCCPALPRSRPALPPSLFPSHGLRWAAPS